MHHAGAGLALFRFSSKRRAGAGLIQVIKCSGHAHLHCGHEPAWCDFCVISRRMIEIAISTQAAAPVPIAKAGGQGSIAGNKTTIRAGLTSSTHLHHDLALGPAFFQICESILRIVERKRLVDHRANTAGLKKFSYFGQLLTVGTHE